MSTIGRAERLKNRGIIALHPEQQFKSQLNRFLPSQSAAAEARESVVAASDIAPEHKYQVALPTFP